MGRANRSDFYDENANGTALIYSPAIKHSREWEPQDSSDSLPIGWTPPTMWTPTTVFCRTPPWGDYYPSMTTRMSLFEGSVELEFRGNELPKFTFAQARWVSVSTDNQNGAKGGDVLTFAGSGFDPTRELRYYCNFTSMEDAAISKLSTKSTALSSTMVQCVTPMWGNDLQAANVTVRLYQENEVIEHLDDAKYTLVTRHEPSGVTVAKFHHGDDWGLVFEFYEVFDSVLEFPYTSSYQGGTTPGGSAFGNQNITLLVYGLDVHHRYGLRFDSASASMLAFHTTPLTHSKIVFVTPPWGNFYSFGTVTLRLLYSPNNHFANMGGFGNFATKGSCPTFMLQYAIAGASYTCRAGTRSELGSGKIALVLPSGRTNNLNTFQWRQEWNRLSLQKGPANGGSVVGIYGAGFDTAAYAGNPTNMRYLCLFTGYSPEFGESATASSFATPVTVTDQLGSISARKVPPVSGIHTILLQCVTPIGAHHFSQPETQISLWYGYYTGTAFSNRYRVNQVGRLRPRVTDSISGPFLSEYFLRTKRSGATGSGIAAFQGDGFDPVENINAKFTFECCYVVNVTVSSLTSSARTRNGDMDLYQNASTTIQIRSWNLPQGLGPKASVNWLKFNAYPNVFQID